MEDSQNEEGEQDSDQEECEDLPEQAASAVQDPPQVSIVTLAVKGIVYDYVEGMRIENELPRQGMLAEYVRGVWSLYSSSKDKEYVISKNWSDWITNNVTVVNGEDMIFSLT